MESISLIDRARLMLASLKDDWHEASDLNKNPSRMVGHINLSDYKRDFGLDDSIGEQAITEYCNTLIKLQPIYPVCPLCNNEWQSLEKIAKPINNGHIIDWVDIFTMWCSNTSHDSIWYYQDKNNTVSFDMEIDNLNGIDYQLRWNCHCAVNECYGKCVLSTMDGEVEYKIVKEFNPPLPLNYSKEEFHKIITESIYV